ncbi:type II toxin-antitoxin system HicB family antitoxin [Candidatus Parcubacteria bacterium]|nr:MAG: type II toxin-antitoxin system HicB family antitoxin [Candidatus Parcubacteria bacterium]
MTKQFKIIVEKHADGYVAYPLGLKGVVVGEGETYEEALADVKSAIAFHIETFGPEVYESESLVLEAFVAEAAVAI